MEEITRGVKANQSKARFSGVTAGILAVLGMVAWTPQWAHADRDSTGGHSGRRRIELPPALTDADFHPTGAHTAAKVELGQMLMFDKILSGNKNIACATCHHPTTGTGDGLALSVGEGGFGLGPARDTNEGETSHVEGRVPRNAPPVFNLAAREFTALFHDGRLAIDFSEPSGFESPAGTQMPMGCHVDPTPPCLENILAAQAPFPVTSDLEMAGQAHENAVGAAGRAGEFAGPSGVWNLLALRLREIPEYVELFKAAFPGHIASAEDVTFVDAANAIGAFEAVTWRSDQSAFDRYLRGEKGALSREQKRGMRLFYGDAGCGSCHSGSLQTDQEFHGIGMPQIGPGKGDGYSGLEDFGRFRVTGNTEDLFAFRTPSLRNVTVTGPWGHAGAYSDLREVVVHHLDVRAGLAGFDLDARLALDADQTASDYEVMQNSDLVDALLQESEALPVDLSDEEVDRLMDFLFALTDMRVLTDRSAIPLRVPSGLSVAD
jgi:cytochrome c peroxidase